MTGRGGGSAVTKTSSENALLIVPKPVLFCIYLDHGFLLRQLRLQQYTNSGFGLGLESSHGKGVALREEICF